MIRAPVLVLVFLNLLDFYSENALKALNQIHRSSQILLYQKEKMPLCILQSATLKATMQSFGGKQVLKILNIIINILILSCNTA